MTSWTRHFHIQHILWVLEYRSMWAALIVNPIELKIVLFLGRIVASVIDDKVDILSTVAFSKKVDRTNASICSIVWIYGSKMELDIWNKMSSPPTPSPSYILKRKTYLGTLLLAIYIEERIFIELAMSIR